MIINMKTKRSIRTSVIIMLGTVIIAVLACQLIFGIFFSKSYFIYIKKNEIQNLFYSIKADYTEESQEFNNTMQDEGFAYNIVILSETGFSFSNRSAMPAARLRMADSGPTSFFIPERFDNFKEEPLAEIIKIDELNTEYIQLTGKFQYNGENRYAMIQMPVQEIDDSVFVISSANAAISVCILILGIIGAIIFSTRFSKPIRYMQGVAQSVSEFDFSNKADVSTSIIELNNLAVSINIMSDKLNELVEDLKYKNERLNRDIDYQKKLDKMRRTFIANVSHELKTPLCLLQLYSENLRNASLDIDRDYYCDTIISEVDSLDVMIKSMLELSMMENGLAKMKIHSFNLSELISRLIQKMLPLFNNTEHEELIEENIFVYADSHYIEQAFKNLLTNAISHTTEKGIIKIGLKQNNSEVYLSVYNTGKHISDEDMSMIWESFYKTDKSRARHNDEIHAGLGLYIVKTIMEAHGGEYGAVNVDGGVEFYLCLKNNQQIDMENIL